MLATRCSTVLYIQCALATLMSGYEFNPPFHYTQGHHCGSGDGRQGVPHRRAVLDDHDARLFRPGPCHLHPSSLRWLKFCLPDEIGKSCDLCRMPLRWQAHAMPETMPEETQHCARSPGRRIRRCQRATSRSTRRTSRPAPALQAARCQAARPLSPTESAVHTLNAALLP